MYYVSTKFGVTWMNQVESMIADKKYYNLFIGTLQECRDEYDRRMENELLQELEAIWQ